MEPTGQNLRAMLTELTRLEDRVWARNPEEARASDRRGEMLLYLMTAEESRHWRSLDAIVAQMRKLI
jgi:hypothetical protein